MNLTYEEEDCILEYELEEWRENLHTKYIDRTIPDDIYWQLANEEYVDYE